MEPILDPFVSATTVPPKYDRRGRRIGKDVKSSEYVKTRPQAAPGSRATKTVLNRPGAAGIKPPVVKPGVMTRVGKVLPRAAAPVIDASTRIAGGENPVDAALRATFGGVGGFIGSTGAGFLGAEPFDPVTSPLAGYSVGYDQGTQLYDKLRGYKPGKATAPSASDMMSGSRGPAPQISYDIPFDQYPAGVPRPDGKVNVDARPLLSITDSISKTDKGKGPKGNVVAQDYDPIEPGIQGSGDPPGLPRAGGRDLSRPALTYGRFAEDILNPMGITPGMYSGNRIITEDGADVAAFAADSGFSKPESAAILGGGTVETVIDGDKPMETTINPAETSAKSRRDRASRAFLDYEGGSMGALRARDEALGLVYQGQNYYAINRDADPNSAESLVKLTQDERRDITNRKSTAQDFLKSKLEQVQSNVEQSSDPVAPVETPAQAQDPAVLPEGFADLSIEESDAAVKAKAKDLSANIMRDNPQGIEDPDYAAMRDADFLKRKAAGLPF